MQKILWFLKFLWFISHIYSTRLENHQKPSSSTILTVMTFVATIILAALFLKFIHLQLLLDKFYKLNYKEKSQTGNIN